MTFNDLQWTSMNFNLFCFWALFHRNSGLNRAAVTVPAPQRGLVDLLGCPAGWSQGKMFWLLRCSVATAFLGLAGPQNVWAYVEMRGNVYECLGSWFSCSIRVGLMHMMWTYVDYKKHEFHAETSWDDSALGRLDALWGQPLSRSVQSAGNSVGYRTRLVMPRDASWCLVPRVIFGAFFCHRFLLRRVNCDVLPWNAV